MRTASRLVVAILLVTAAGVAYTAPASSSVPAWSIVPSAGPPGAPSGFLSSVACASATNCFAVGDFASGYSGGVLLEHFDGTVWSLVSLPIPDTGIGTNASAVLSDVACPGPTTCFAVGAGSIDKKSQALIERWDGTTWSILSSPSAALLNDLTSVACSSETQCFAVSNASTQIVQWNGSTWSAAASPSVPDGSALFGVSCASTICFAVGSAYINSQNALLIEEWNGTAWSVVTSPAPAGASFLELKAVSCATPTSCLAVGSYELGQNTDVLIERWNGTSWSIATSPKFLTPASGELLDVSCSGASDCTAVGDARQGAKKPSLSLVEHWNGTSWSTVSSPNADPKSDFLYGVSCSSSASCLAVGFTGGGLATSATIESWNGTRWSVVATPQQTPSNSTLSEVSCPTPTTCFGVGQYVSATGAASALIERSGPTGWSVVAVPKPAGVRTATLAGVSCVSVTACFAVGQTGGSLGKPLIERWNGKTWSITPSPSDARYDSYLTAVSCTSVKNCFAVGALDASTLETFVERWNGSKWSVVPSPSRRPSPNFETEGVNSLQGVSCATATSCFAVGGDTGYNANFNETLVLRWNGSKWTIVKSPNGPGGKYSTLSGVSCPSATNCYAVGNSSAAPGLTAPLHSLIEHWNGTAWTRVTSADPGTRRNALSSVSCASATSCVAVGGDSGTSGRNSTLVENLSGTTWSTVPSPNPAGAVDAFFHAVSCPSAVTCFAVGDFDQFSAPRPLVEQYS